MTARTGMTNLITELRGMVEAGTADYALGTISYWSDDHLQDVLDVHRTDLYFVPLQILTTVGAGGTTLYQDYRAPAGYLEATTGGTAITYLQDSTGVNIGTANYTPDYRRGQFQFATNQGGTAYYLTTRSYDLKSAAADIWRRKAAHYAPTSFDFSTDNHSIQRSQVYQHCVEMADFWQGQSGGAVQTVQMFRSDM